MHNIALIGGNHDEVLELTDMLRVLICNCLLHESQHGKWLVLMKLLLDVLPILTSQWIMKNYIKSELSMIWEPQCCKCSSEMLIKMTTATFTKAKLNKIWKSQHITFQLKHKLYRTLVLSLLLSGCESWTPLVEGENPGIWNWFCKETLSYTLHQPHI